MVKTPPAFPRLHPLVLELVGPLDYTVVPVALTPKASQPNTASSHTSLLSAGGLYPSDRHISGNPTPVPDAEQHQAVNRWAQLAVSAAPTTDEDQHPAEYFDTAEQEQYFPEDGGTSRVAYDYSATDTSNQAGQSYEGPLDDGEYQSGYMAHRAGSREVSGAGEMLDDDADGEGSLYDDVPDTATESKPATASVHESSRGNLHAGSGNGEGNEEDENSSDFFGSDPDDDDNDDVPTAAAAVDEQDRNAVPGGEDGDNDEEEDDMEPF
jgi:hypothetical protein